MVTRATEGTLASSRPVCSPGVNSWKRWAAFTVGLTLNWTLVHYHQRANCKQVLQVPHRMIFDICAFSTNETPVTWNKTNIQYRYTCSFNFESHYVLCCNRVAYVTQWLWQMSCDKLLFSSVTWWTFSQRECWSRHTCRERKFISEVCWSTQHVIRFVGCNSTLWELIQFYWLAYWFYPMLIQDRTNNLYS